MLSDAEDAALYDLQNPWDPEHSLADRFFHERLMLADSALDVGCGTGAMLIYAREHGHVGRLVGLDPNRSFLNRARRRTDVEWVEGTAESASWTSEFALAIMTGHAFQCLVTDHEVRSSLTAIHRALRPGGHFVFETRHPQARAWEGWNPMNRSRIVDSTGRTLLGWHQVETVIGDVVTFTGTTADIDGTVLAVGRTSLRFLDQDVLGAFLTEAEFQVESQYGDWDRTPINDLSREIITSARRLT